MRKRLWLSLCAVLLLCTGCWDKAELENRGFIVSLGIDKASDDAEDTAYDLTMTLPNIAAIAGKDGAEGETRTLLHAQADTLAAAMRMADAQTGQTLYYGHTKIAVFGANVLSDEILFKQAADALGRNNELSQKLIILATEDSAAKVLDAKSPNEPLIGTFVSNFYKNSADDLHVTVRADLEQLLLQLNTTGDIIIPRISIEDDEIRLSGAAVVKDAALAGWLNEAETRGLLWLRGEGVGTILTAHLPSPTAEKPLHVPFRTLRNRRTLSFHESADGLVCRLTLRATGSIEELTVSPDMLISDDILHILSQKFEAEITREAAQTFALFQTEYGVDAADFLRTLYKQNPGLYRKYVQDPEDAFRQMTLEADVHVTIVR